MGHPLGDEEGVVLGEEAFVEDEEELAAVGAETLDGVRIAGGEEPEIALFDIVDEDGAVGVEDSDAGVAVEHESPLVGGVPVHLAEAAGCEAHVYAGDGGRRRQLALCDLVGPAAFFHALAGEIEGVPDGADVAEVGFGRGVGVGVLGEQRTVFGSGVTGGVAGFSGVDLGAALCVDRGCAESDGGE